MSHALTGSQSGVTSQMNAVVMTSESRDSEAPPAADVDPASDAIKSSSGVPHQQQQQAASDATGGSATVVEMSPQQSDISTADGT